MDELVGKVHALKHLRWKCRLMLFLLGANCDWQVEARREARVRVIAATRIQSVIRGKFGRSEVG